MRGGEEHRRGTGLGLGEDRCALGPHRIKHGNKILAPHLPRWEIGAGGALRRSAPPPIEEDQPTEGGKSAVEGGFRSHVPLQIQLAEAVVVDEVERAFADDLIGYFGFANSHISRLRRVHSKQPRRHDLSIPARSAETHRRCKMIPITKSFPSATLESCSPS